MMRGIINQLNAVPTQFIRLAGPNPIIVIFLAIFVGALTIFNLVIGLFLYPYPIFPITSCIYFPDGLVELGTMSFLILNLMLLLMGLALVYISKCTAAGVPVAAPVVVRIFVETLMSFSVTVAQMALFVGASFVLLLLAPSSFMTG